MTKAERLEWIRAAREQAALAYQLEQQLENTAQQRMVRIQIARILRDD